MLDVIETYAYTNVPQPKFVCACGEELENPGDPAVMAVHQPHYPAAKRGLSGLRPHPLPRY